MDLDGVAHTVEVTASTLYEAVAQGLVAIRGREWVAGVATKSGPRREDGAWGTRAPVRGAVETVP